jgi:RND superfamily putative drug exporter
MSQRRWQRRQSDQDRGGRSFTERLARASATHPWRTIGIWLAIIVVAVLGVGPLLSSGLTSEMKQHGEQPDSAIALELIADRMTGEKKMTDFVIVQSATRTVDDPVYEAYVTGLAGKIQELGPAVVEGAATYYQTGDPTMVSQDKRSTLVAVVMAGDTDNALENVASLHRLVSRSGGDTTRWRNSGVSRDARSSRSSSRSQSGA